MLKAFARSFSSPLPSGRPIMRANERTCAP
jgi:hypothetical protein